MPRVESPKEETKNVMTNVFVIYEGHRTEREYFIHFQNKHRGCNFKFTDVEKKNFDRHNTIRGEMVQLMKGRSTYLSTGAFTPYYFCTAILGKYSELIGLNSDLENYEEKRANVADRIIERAQNDNICFGNYIYEQGRFIDIAKEEISLVNSKFDAYSFNREADRLKKVRNMPPQTLIEEMMKIYYNLRTKDKDDIDEENALRCERLYDIRNVAVLDAAGITSKDGLLTDRNGMLDILMGHIIKDKEYRSEFKKSLISPDIWDTNPKRKEKGDRSFVVFDRDFDSNRDDPTRTDDYYRSVFDECEGLGYEVLLSTPAFEIWLLMHHEGVDYRKIRYTDRRILNRMIMELEKIPEKRIKMIDKDRFSKNYENTFDIALRNSKCLDIQLEQLLKKIGTNVGIKLDSLLHY